MYSRTIQSIGDNAKLIDMQLFGLDRVGAAYLLHAGRSCLIDSGTPAEARNLIKALDSIGAFPPDLLLLTHSHFDHTQGTPLLCREARKRGKEIMVLASEKALPRLRDQSWNRVFDEDESFASIRGVSPLADGQIIDLEGLELEVLDFAGHCGDDIAVHDRKNGMVFVGDALGYTIEHRLTFPPFMPPFWDPAGFRAAAARLAELDYHTLCLAHFGCIRGEEAAGYPAFAVKNYDDWWSVFEHADRAGKLDDLDYLSNALLQGLGIELPNLTLSKPHMRAALAATNVIKRALRRRPIRVVEVQLEAVLGWLIKGYRGYRARSAGDVDGR